MKTIKKYYVVWEGRKKGIFTDWPYVHDLVKGYKGAQFKGYKTRKEAEKAFAGDYFSAIEHHNDGETGSNSNTKNIPLVRAIAVDAACSGNPGKLEYRGVSLWDKKVIFHQKYPVGTNNIGEFIAIVHALALLKDKDSKDIVIYSDSKIAMNWVKAGKCRTKLDLTPQTVELFNVIMRAEKWLKENQYENTIIKWQTEKWGEIPADFGRK